MTRARSVAIAGAGVAGLASAILLSRAGWRVTVFERFERARPVGSGLILQPPGMAVLDALGLGDRVREKGAPIRRLFGKSAGSDRVVLDVRYSALGGEGAHGVGLHRASLFDVLHGAALEEQVVIETGKAVLACPPLSGGRRELHFVDGASAGPFDLVIDALGSRSAFLSSPGRLLDYGALWGTVLLPDRADFQQAALEQRYLGARRMVGVLPIGDAPDAARGRHAAFFWSLRHDRYDAWLQDGLDAWKAEVQALWPLARHLASQFADPAALTFARYAHRTVANPAEAGLIHIGDAWRATSPQLGQGANMALLDAYALAGALRDRADLGEALAAFVRRRRRHVLLYQAMSWLFTPFYQSDNRVLPLLRDRIAGPLARLPPAQRFLAVLVSGQLGGPLRGLE